MKLVIISAVIAGAYIWHVQDVTHKVEQAVITERNSLLVQYSKQAIKLQDNAYLAEVQLKAEIKKVTDDKQKALSDSNAKYNDLLKWLSSQPNSASTGKQSSVPDSTSTGESTKGTNGQGLLQGNAENTARPDEAFLGLLLFAKSTEELKVYLLTCERQYDKVVEDQEKFRLQNTPKID